MSNLPEAEVVETLNDHAAFTARRKTGNEGTIFASGDFLYRIFPTAQRVFFIKIGAGTDQSIALLFGVLGVAIHKMRTKGKATAETQARLSSFQGQRPALLLSQDPANHVLQRQQVNNPVIEPPSMWTGGKFGKWIFRDEKKKKRIFFFEDVENFQSAVECLRAAFGEELVVRAQYDPVKNKIVKT